MNKQIEIEEALNEKMNESYKAPRTRQMSPFKAKRKAQTPQRKSKKMLDDEEEQEEPKPPTLPAKVILQIDKMVEEKVREIYPMKEYKSL